MSRRTYIDMGRNSRRDRIEPTLLVPPTFSEAVIEHIRESNRVMRLFVCNPVVSRHGPPDQVFYFSDPCDPVTWGFRPDRIQPTFEEAFGCADPNASPDEVAAATVERADEHVEPEIAALPRKERYEAWRARTVRELERARRERR